MDYGLTKQQKEIQKAVREFVKGEFKEEIIEELVEKHEYPIKIWKKAAELGFIGIHFPEEYSGEGLGVLENILVAEELCKGDSSVGACLIQSAYASEIVLHFGSEEQKKKWLPKVAEGKCLSCGAFTEADHGSDITSMLTTAVKEGDEWIINGSKIFITNGGPLAGFYSVLCQTDPDAAPSYRGLSLILVEADRPGVTATDGGDKMGIRLMDTVEVNFKDVRVPLSNLIGKENRGFYQVLEFIGKSRILIAAQALGTAQGAFEQALAYAKQREQFGKPIGKFQAISHKIADMAVKIQAARLMAYATAKNLDMGNSNIFDASAAKLFASEVAVSVAIETVQIFGGYGFMREYPVFRYLQDALAYTVGEGTSEIQRNIIAKELGI